MVIFRRFTQPALKIDMPFGTDERFAMPTVKAPPGLFKAYEAIFKRDMAALEGFDDSTILEMLQFVMDGEGKYHNLGRYYEPLFERYFLHREWSWPEYDGWRSYFYARQEWPLGWPEDEKTLRSEPLTNPQKRRTYNVLMSTIFKRASSYYDQSNQERDGITSGSISTTYPENEGIIRDILAENPDARPPLFPYDVSLWTPTIPGWIDEPSADSSAFPLTEAPDQTDWVYKCPECMGEIDEKASVCKWCRTKFNSGMSFIGILLIAIFGLIFLMGILSSITSPALTPAQQEEWLRQNGNDPKSLDKKFGTQSEAACSVGANDYLRSIATYDFKWDADTEGLGGFKFDQISRTSAGNGLLTDISTRVSLSNQFGAFQRFRLYCLYDVRQEKVVRYSQTDPADEISANERAIVDDALNQETSGE